MQLDKPITEIIRQRFSCRKYLKKPIAEHDRQKLSDFLSSVNRGPFGAQARFELVAAAKQDQNALKGLGTYGFIRNAAGFIVGVVRDSEKSLEDFGYLMEKTIIYATDIGLGTCWLGGSFTKSRFAKKISLTYEEQLPAVTSIGYIADRSKSEDRLRRYVGADSRKDWEKLFFKDNFDNPLLLSDAGPFSEPLEMVRLGPSASNKQPWRVVKEDNSWHFFLRRTKGYRDGFIFRFLNLADLQRVDMGIAMCHFELTSLQMGLQGKWIVQEPNIKKSDDTTEYIASWTHEEFAADF